MSVGIIERACQLARSGEFQHLEEVKRRLNKEGYEGGFMHLGGKHTKGQLRRMMIEAKRARA